MASRPWMWLGILTYIVKILFWIAFLSFVDLSEGVLLSSINIVVIMVAGWLLFREKLTPLRITGILLVSTGVAIVGMGG
jgi:drug/metabolite transporter (DMT)-like permease